MSRSALRFPGLRFVGSVAGWMVLLAVTAFLVTTVAVPRAVGGTAYTVLTSSMRPTMPPGTLVITRSVDPAAVAVGDAITYQIESGKPAVVTHRVTAVRYAASGELSFVTQGDNNPSPDRSPVRPVQVRGEVWYAVPYAGFVNNALTASRRATVIGVVVGGLVLYALIMFGSALRSRHRPQPVPRRSQAGTS